MLANYPNRDGRLANGVGLDTPQSVVDILTTLDGAGYQVSDAPADSADLMKRIQAGPTNWLADRADRAGGERLSATDYLAFYMELPWEVRERIETRWGKPEDDDPFFGDGGFALSILRFGNVVVGIQPARGYNIDPKETYHSPDLVPAAQLPRLLCLVAAVLRNGCGDPFRQAPAIWNGCPARLWRCRTNACPEIVLGPVPHLYPFIVNDPGEGTQAKRRSSAVILDHLTPPLTRAETYGPLKDLEALVDEYYEASGVDPRRLDHLRREIRDLVSAERLDVDAGITPDMDEDAALQQLDTYLCELKESQIRDGLHVFGSAPEGDLERDLAIALLRVPRGDGRGGNASLIRALARDCGNRSRGLRSAGLRDGTAL